MVSGYQSNTIATALSKPSTKAIFFNKASVRADIAEGSTARKSELIKLSTRLDSDGALLLPAQSVQLHALLA